MVASIDIQVLLRLRPYPVRGPSALVTSSHHSSLQVTPDQLMTALTTRAIETMGERIVKNLDAAAASVSRDALAKNLYAKLFDWLVAAINRKISAIGKQSLKA